TLAGQDFGEREHLLLALVAPYLLLAVARSLGRDVRPGPAVLIGLLAGSAFGLKPHFVLLWVAVEGYLRLTRRVHWGALLPETLAIAGFLASYLLATVLWAPGYLRLVQLLAGQYTRFLYVPFWQLLVRGPWALFTMCALLAYGALRRYAKYPPLVDLFAFGTLVCLVAGAAQQKGFSYHFYPSFGLATIVLGLLALDRGAPLQNWVGAVFRVIAISMLATVGTIACVRNVATAIRPTRDTEQAQMELLLPVVRDRAAGERVYVMSYNISSAYPLINYAGAHSASRFAQLWILAAAYMDQLKGSRPLRYHATGEMSPSERYMNQAVLEDLRQQRPKLLAILQHARDLPANGFRRLDYLAYFSRDPRIATILEGYQLVANVGDFVVYERVAEGAARSGPPPTVQPGTRDVIQAGQASGTGGRVGHPETLLALAAFVISAIIALLTERGKQTRRPGHGAPAPS
ncbi:MAG TPA: hypothetical protein VM536_21810, partial [Chloroflexia bacterium]|nr:hypothetical protein [Chloroflexia bacterium]